ncbi:MAG: hypothetical protein ABIN01_00710 [Ferruginibacter sp.]
MQLITKAYLTDIIVRAVNETIELRRASQKNNLYHTAVGVANEDELLYFIQSIPDFDERLKNFLLEQQKEASTIISQAWETSFIVKCKAWAKSNDWLHKDPIVAVGFYPKYIINWRDVLSLPY